MNWPRTLPLRHATLHPAACHLAWLCLALAGFCGHAKSSAHVAPPSSHCHSAPATATCTPAPTASSPAPSHATPVDGYRLYRPIARPEPSYLRVQWLQPQLNLSPEQLAIAARRHRLPPSARLECSALDTRLPQLERAARRAKSDLKGDAEQALQDARQRFTTLRC